MKETKSFFYYFLHIFTGEVVAEADKSKKAEKLWLKRTKAPWAKLISQYPQVCVSMFFCMCAVVLSVLKPSGVYS